MDQPVTRIWDNELNQLYSSATDPRTPEQFMIDHAFDVAFHAIECNYTIDHGQGFTTREGGKIIYSRGRVIRYHTTSLLIQP